MENTDSYVDLNIKSYIKIYKNKVSEDLSKEIINNISNLNFEEHTFFNPKSNESVNLSGSQELEVLYNKHYMNDELNQIIWDSIYQYHCDLNFEWMDSWNGYSFPRWNKYSKNKKMALHCDRIKSLFEGENQGDPTLTVLGLLHSDFSGGELVMQNDILENYEAGDIVVFPSNFLYPHKVKPILSGLRYSFVSWTW